MVSMSSRMWASSCPRPPSSFSRVIASSSVPRCRAIGRRIKTPPTVRIKTTDMMRGATNSHSMAQTPVDWGGGLCAAYEGVASGVSGSLPQSSSWRIRRGGSSRSSNCPSRAARRKRIKKTTASATATGTRTATMFTRPLGLPRGPDPARSERHVGGS